MTTNNILNIPTKADMPLKGNDMYNFDSPWPVPGDDPSGGRGQSDAARAEWTRHSVATLTPSAQFVGQTCLTTQIHAILISPISYLKSSIALDGSLF